MGDDTRDYWKPQATLVIAAFIMFALAAAELWRSANAWTRRSLAAIITLALIGFGLLWMAATISDWCAPPHAVWTAGPGGLTWDTHAWHEPTLRDCLAVRR